MIHACSGNKNLFIYTIPGEGLPIIKALKSTTVTAFTDIKDKESLVQVDISEGETLQWIDSCIIVEQPAKASIGKIMDDNVWLYTITNGEVVGDKEGQVSLKPGDSIDVLSLQSEEYYIVKKGGSIFDLHSSFFTMESEPKTFWYIKDKKSNYWFLIDKTNIDVSERTF